jgi:hypothetical protein
LRSMILIAQNKRPPKGNAAFPGGNIAHNIPSSDPMHGNWNNRAGTRTGSDKWKKSPRKKAKRQHPLPNPTPTPSPTQDGRGASYFRNEHLLSRSCSARDGVESELASRHSWDESGSGAV